MTKIIRWIGPALFSVFAWTAVAQDADRYEDLMTSLATADSAADANGLVPQIWAHWLTAPDAPSQAVLDAAMDRRSVRDYLGALGHLDTLVVEYPGYAEGWNQRATIYYLIGEFDASLADVEKVLALEPRHFGALAGRAMIYMRQGRIPLAQLAVQEALRHHPFLNERAILNVPGSKDI